MKIALVGINPFNGNLGVCALSYSILYILDRISKRCNFSIRYYILDLLPPFLGKKYIYIDDIKIEFIGMRQFTQKGIKGLVKKVLFFGQYIKYNQKFDFVFDLSAGDSFSDIYGIDRFNKHNDIKRFFIKKNIKIMLLPQTIGPFFNKFNKEKAVKTIENCNIVIARDGQSYNFLRTTTNQKNIGESLDLAFFLPYRKKIFSNNCINVGLNISALLWHGGYTHNNQFSLNVDYHYIIKQIIDYFLLLKNVRLHIVPHVIELSPDHVENDYEVSSKLIKTYPGSSIILAPLFLDPIQAKSYIAGLDFFMGARMHATIAAFSTRVPVFPMAYSRKFNGLYIESLHYPYLGDMVTQSHEDILDNIKISFKKREELKKIITQYVESILVQKRDELEKCIIDFLGLENGEISK
jgi:polysaccharide pyruvyl transferase WcaK-like protein